MDRGDQSVLLHIVFMSHMYDMLEQSDQVHVQDCI